MTPDDGRDVDVDPDVLDRVATLVANSPGARPIEILTRSGVDIRPTPGLLALVEDLQERRADGVDDVDEFREMAKSRLRRAVEDDSPDVNPGGSDDKGGSARADDRDEGEGPTYQDLYFDAVDRADRDPGQLVPEPAIREAFASAGHAGVVDHLGGLADWIVWTPDGADETLYLYTPDLAGDTSAERARVAELLRAAGAGTERFIDCHDGHKGSFDTGNDRAPDDPEISGNYGIKGGTGADADADGLHLVDIDVDDYDEGKAANERVDDLREETLAVASAHTPLDRPGHQFVLVDGDPRAVVRDVLGRDVENPAASFGEIRVANQYVVGPGSEIICPCDRCTGDDADERGYGRYEIANEAPPVVWTEAEFEAFLRADPAIDEAGRDADDLASDGATGDLDRAGDGGGSGSGGSATGTLSDAVDARLSVGRAVDEYLVEAIRAARAPDDRSAADASLARRVAPWVNNDRDAIAEVLDRHGTEKWATRTDESYRSSVLEYATDRGTAYDPLPFWALREYALAEGVVDEDDLVRRTSDGGDVVDEGGGDGEGDGDGEDPEGGSGTYLGFPDADAYNAALDAVEDAGVSHGRARADEGGGGPGRADIRVCDPPDRDAVTFDPEARYDALQGDRLDAALDSDALEIWADAPGAGKTRNAGIGVLRRDVSHFAAFDKHRTCREHVTDPILDDAVPTGVDADDAVDVFHHQKGGAQRRYDVCMDADHAGEPCPEHGETVDCPSMCPVYDLPDDDPRRALYKAVEREVGSLDAHLILGLDDEDEHPWHGGDCAWQRSYAAAEASRHVAGVHPYLTQQLARDGDLTIVDETPGLNATDRTLDVEDLTRQANAIEHIADAQPRDDPTRYTLRRLADLARDVVGAITDPDAPDDLAALDAPAVCWTAYEASNSAAGNYVEREPPEESWHLAEALARAKIRYGEAIRRRMHRDEWDGAPISVDPLLAAAVDAGLDREPVMRAVALPPTLDVCPWCRGDLDVANGARYCPDGGCGWTEREDALIRRDGDRGRAIAWLQTGDRRERDGLAYRDLPLPSDLPPPDETLVLDATATPAKLACLFGVDRDDVVVSGDEPLDVPGMRLIQVADGQYHKSTIKQGETARRRIQRTIDTAADVHERPLYIVARKLKPLFDFPDDAEVLHYHAARGLDRSECDAVVCIGAPHPDLDDLRRDARLLAMHRDDDVGGEEYSTRRDAPNGPEYRRLHYEDETGQGRAVPTKAYSGLLGDLFRETREKELEQAVHRARPLHADPDDPVDVYLLTNVPTSLQVDELVAFEDLADPLEALLPVPDGALDLLAAVRDVAAGDAPDGFRAVDLVEFGDGKAEVANKIDGYHRLARAAGVSPRGSDGVPARGTVDNWVGALEDVGLLEPGDYEQRAGVSYAADFATLQSALSVLGSNAGFKVAAVRRFRALAERGDGSLAWLDWAREALGLAGDRCARLPPPEMTDHDPG